MKKLKLGKLKTLQVLIVLFMMCLVIPAMTIADDDNLKVFEIPKDCVKVVEQESHIEHGTFLFFFDTGDYHLRVTCENKQEEKRTVVREIDIDTQYKFIPSKN